MGSTVLELPSRRALRVERIEDLDSLRDDWAGFAEANGNVFSTWEWSNTWWRHFGDGKRLAIAVLRDADDVAAAIVPLYVFAERPLRIVRLLGHGHGDALGPLVDPAVVEPAEALRLALEAERFDLFIGDFVPADGGFAETLAAKMLLRTGYPILRTADQSWADFVASRGVGFRDIVGKRLRKLERKHGAHFRLANRATLEDDLDAVFSLHRARFEEHGACFFCGAGSEAFHRDFAAVALEHGWLRLWILELEGEPVAAEYGFCFAGSFFDYQTGRASAWDHLSVGMQVEARMLRDAFEEEAGEYRFLRGDEPYKLRFATHDPGLEMIAVARSARARAALAGFSVVRRVPYVSEFARRLAR